MSENRIPSPVARVRREHDIAELVGLPEREAGIGARSARAVQRHHQRHRHVTPVALRNVDDAVAIVVDGERVLALDELVPRLVGRREDERILSRKRADRARERIKSRKRAGRDKRPPVDVHGSLSPAGPACYTPSR